MDVAALVAWLVTAGGGVYLFGTWLAHGGMSRGDGAGTRLPLMLILSHAGLAAAGLIVWIAYLVLDDASALPWIALALLVAVALLGFTMFFRWLPARRRTTGEVALAEQRFPAIVVVAHGLLAVTTVVLVLLAAIDSA